MRLPRASVTLASLLVLALSAGHTGRAKAQATPKDPTADPVMLNAGFLSAHPDLNNRLRGLDAYRKAFNKGDSVIVLDSNDPFLKYMKADR